jgi:hypothetical protein
MSDDKIEEIRARYAGYSLNSGNAAMANQDRGWLLAEVERLTRERDEAWAGIERLRNDLRQGFPIRYEIAAGCLCPAGANMNCQNSFCPRRNPPGVTCSAAAYAGKP